MKFFLLLFAATPLFSAMIPFYPEYAYRPDSAYVRSVKDDAIQYTIKFSYNSDGYLTKGVYYFNGQQTGYSESHYQKTGDTIKCTYTITDEPDNKYLDLYILDKNNNIVKYIGYDSGVQYDDQIILYNQDNKISKTVTAVASFAADIGDSVVYKYQNGKIRTVDVYGDRGSKWSYSDYETDTTGRVIKSKEYDCTKGCEADTVYNVYFYGTSQIKNMPLKLQKSKSQ